MLHKAPILTASLYQYLVFRLGKMLLTFLFLLQLLIALGVMLTAKTRNGRSLNSKSLNKREIEGSSKKEHSFGFSLRSLMKYLTHKHINGILEL